MQPERQCEPIGSPVAPIVVVANRLPVDASLDDDGEVEWTRSPGGLSAAVSAAMADREAVWIGWSGARGGVDPIPQAPEGCRYSLVNVTLSERLIEDYYEGFCNSTLWPLYHDRIVAPVFRERTWEAYVEANEHFARRVSQTAAEGTTVWVHDYHLQLLPRGLRSTRPDVKVGFYLHIPFPTAHQFAELPWGGRIVDGILGADIVGFQTPLDARNFFEVATLDLGYEGEFHSSSSGWIDDGHGRQVRIGSFPASIDVARYAELATSREVRALARQIRKDLGDPDLLLLGVDRMDYTKGIAARLGALVDLIEDRMIDPMSTAIVQIATPTREHLMEYRRLRGEVESLVDRVSSVGEGSIHYVDRMLPPERLAAFYVAADVLVVTALRDGMNLVAKEYVACQVDDDGALVLSEFTGAALELSEAWLVDPYSPDSIRQAIMSAIEATPDDRRRRMSTMRAHLQRHDATRWSTEFLDTLAEV